MAIPETYANLVSRLINLTRENKVSWEPADMVATTRFKAAIGDSGVNLKFDPDAFDGTVNLSIANARGDVIDSFEVSEAEPDYGEMKGLYDAARRGALRVDETITELERGLEQLGRPEGDPSS